MRYNNHAQIHYEYPDKAGPIKLTVYYLIYYNMYKMAPMENTRESVQHRDSSTGAEAFRIYPGT